MKVVGDPTLHAKSIVEVRGISGLLSGKYYVTNVKHIISASGYVCDLKLTKDGAGRRARQLAQQQQGAVRLSCGSGCCGSGFIRDSCGIFRG